MSLHSRHPMVFVVDNDPDCTESVRRLADSVALQVEAYTSGLDFFDHVNYDRPGCLVLELRLPDMSGLEFQRALRARGFTLPFIFLTTGADVPDAVTAMKAGAFDFIEKPFRSNALLGQIQSAITRDRAFREKWTKRLEAQERTARLTRRERQVMELVISGLQNKQIAERLQISPKTVEIHRYKMMRKLEAHSVAELVRTADLSMFTRDEQATVESRMSFRDQP
ncbi:MAG: LuxR C-terminal-related transcriptional regulator [Planctomycetota bacterium]|nr:LuxR C-terminal-related transcriptional regulator [Planctomycetota bacterium]